MENLTLSLGIIRPCAVEPLEGHSVVVLETIGEAGEVFRFEIEPGQRVPPARRSLFEVLRGRKPPHYFAYAVTRQPELPFTFSTDVTLDKPAHTFTLLVTLAYNVSEPRLVVARRNDDPMRQVRDQISRALTLLFASLPLNEIHHELRVTEGRVVDAVLEPGRQFAALFGIHIQNLTLSNRPATRDLADVSIEETPRDGDPTDQQMLREWEHAALEQTNFFLEFKVNDKLLDEVRARALQAIDNAGEAIRTPEDLIASVSNLRDELMKLPRRPVDPPLQLPADPSTITPSDPAPGRDTNAERALTLDSDGSRLYTVWYGTNRRPLNPIDHSDGFTGERDPCSTHYGTCQIAIPQSHRFGSVGSSWLRRFVTMSDDRLYVRYLRPYDEYAFWESIRREIADASDDERQAVVYVHGFNVTFEEAVIRAAQIGCDLKVPGVTALFSWPSAGDVEGYPEDEASIEASEAAITEFLVQFANQFGVGRVHVIAHSMGNRGLLRAMQRIHADAQRRSDVKFGQIILAAPDVDADTFRDLAVLYPRSSRRTTLYASPGDKAVELSRWFHGAARAGFTPPVTVVAGIDTIQVPAFDLDLLGHSYYAEAAGVLHDMFDLLRFDSAPSGRQRLHIAKRDDGVQYWTMQA